MQPTTVGNPFQLYQQVQQLQLQRESLASLVAERQATAAKTQQDLADRQQKAAGLASLKGMVSDPAYQMPDPSDPTGAATLPNYAKMGNALVGGGHLDLGTSMLNLNKDLQQQLENATKDARTAEESKGNALAGVFHNSIKKDAQGNEYVDPHALAANTAAFVAHPPLGYTPDQAQAFFAGPNWPTDDPAAQLVTAKALISRYATQKQQDDWAAQAKSAAETEKFGAEAAAARAKAAPVDPVKYQAQIDAIVPPTDTANAGLRQMTIARVQNARTVEDADKAIEDAAQQVGRVNVAKATVPLKIEVAQGSRPAPTDKLIKVEHQDPGTGRTVIEWLPESEVRGQTFQKGVTGTTESRLASAQAVNQTGQQIIARLQDPTVASQLGPVMGRYTSVRQFIGNPPPEYAELAGQIESYALASMGVHGMRSAQGAEQIKKMLDAKQTPESLIAAIKGLNAFSQNFMQNQGYGGTTAAPATGPATHRFNPATGQLEVVK